MCIRDSHWADAKTALDAEVRLYDNLFLDPEPEAGDKDFLTLLNPNSLEILTGCKVERGLQLSLIHIFGCALLL